MKRQLINLKERLLKRWSDGDYPGAQKRFQLRLVGKDFGIFVLIPLMSILIVKMVEASINAPNPARKSVKQETNGTNLEKTSQIIVFDKARGGPSRGGGQLRSPGTLVRVRLLNTTDVASTSPVHAQVLDYSLGREYFGGTAVGEASFESATGRVKIEFKFARSRSNIATVSGLSGRALSLDGRFGVEGIKKEGLFARSALKAGSSIPVQENSSEDRPDFRSQIIQAIASSFIQEFQGEAGLAHAKSQIISLKPNLEFFIELTDYFPGKK